MKGTCSMIFCFLQKAKLKFIELYTSKINMEILVKLLKYKIWEKEAFMGNISTPINSHLQSESLQQLKVN
jgi:hypothetical protein